MAKKTVQAYVVGKHDAPIDVLPDGYVVVDLGDGTYRVFDSEDSFQQEWQWIKENRGGEADGEETEQSEEESIRVTWEA